MLQPALKHIQGDCSPQVLGSVEKKERSYVKKIKKGGLTSSDPGDGLPFVFILFQRRI